MRHKNGVKQLGRTFSHRKAMFNNMLTSFFQHERIETTKQKAKVLKRLSEKMITRAKKNLDLADSNPEKALHNKREVLKKIKDRDIVAKLFNDIALRNKDRNGGYTRIYLLGNRRIGDNADMAIIELVERKKQEAHAADASIKDEVKAKADKKANKKAEKEDKKEKKSKKEK